MIELVALPGVRESVRKSWTRHARWLAVAAMQERLPHELDEEVRRLVGGGWVEELVIRSDNQADLVRAVVAAARASGRRVRMVSRATVVELPQALPGERWVHEEDEQTTGWVLIPRQRVKWQLAIKRLLDILLSAALLLLLAPVLVITGIAVKLTSEGPVFYRWRVLGENGRPFIGFKFRTMVRDADSLKADLWHLNERSGPVFKMAHDPRVTPLGRVLRKYSIDELPQLWSVLTGDMSLVGPRPVFPSEYAKFELWQMRKLSVKPGLTCVWQVVGRQHITDFSEWARLDLGYIDTWSLWNDLKILVSTPRAIVKGTGH